MRFSYLILVRYCFFGGGLHFFSEAFERFSYFTYHASDVFKILLTTISATIKIHGQHYMSLKTKISIIKLNSIKYLIKTDKTLAFRGCHVVSLCFKPRMISKNKKETFKPKIKQITQQLKCCLCLQNQQIFMPLGHDRQPTVSRSLLVRFSLTSR